MKIYLGIKFYPDSSNKDLIDSINKVLTDNGHTCYCVARDLEKWGKVSLSSKELMEITFKEIRNSDIILIEFSEKGVGLGIEAGYAVGQGIPVSIIAKYGSDISNTISGIAEDVYYYNRIEDIKDNPILSAT